MMASASDNDPSSHPTKSRIAPRLSGTTEVDAADPFGAASDLEVGTRHTQTSDPPTALVRRDSFRELPPGCVVNEIYEIDARLGAGAMGEVYAARHMKLGKRVAIKVIGRRLSEDEAAIERFAMEARTLAQIQHPAIVAVEHVGELADGRAYFVMEFLRGESLFERLQRGRVPLPEALRIIDQMARGLDAAHGQGVIHRDLKPENTFLVHLPGEPPAVKLVDFGLAKLRDADADFRAERTQSGVAIGTPMYMSPEQARGPDVDHGTDIYALGCVAYELMLGVAPFPHARTAPELYAAHLHEVPPVPRTIWSEIPPQLDLCLFAMLAKDPAHRPTLAQIRDVLATVRSGVPAQRAATEFVGPRVGRQPRRILTAVIVTAVAAIAMSVGITIGSRGPSEVTDRPATPPRNRRRDIEAPALVLDRSPVSQPDPPAASTTPITTNEIPTPPKTTAKTRASTRPSSHPTKSHPVRSQTPSSHPQAGRSAGSVIDARPPIAEPPQTLPEQQPSKPVDRNQTINPFTNKKASPRGAP